MAIIFQFFPSQDLTLIYLNLKNYKTIFKIYKCHLVFGILIQNEYILECPDCVTTIFFIVCLNIFQ